MYPEFCFNCFQFFSTALLCGLELSFCSETVNIELGKLINYIYQYRCLHKLFCFRGNRIDINNSIKKFLLNWYAYCFFILKSSNHDNMYLTDFKISDKNVNFLCIFYDKRFSYHFRDWVTSRKLLNEAMITSFLSSWNNKEQ